MARSSESEPIRVERAPETVEPTMGIEPESAYLAARIAALSFAPARKDCIVTEAISTLEEMPSNHRKALLAPFKNLAFKAPTDEVRESAKIIKTRGIKISDETPPRSESVKFIFKA